MNVRVKLSGIALLGALAALVLPASALAEYYVPPGNSAANQYTETLPSAGGDSAGKGKGVTPAQALGAKNADKLAAHGAAGKAAAELAAETAPVVIEPSAGEDQGGNGNAPSHSGQGSGQNAKGDTGGGQAEIPAQAPRTTTAVAISDSAGSSGLSSVLGQATGVSDDGSLGLWLPLIILAAIAGTIVYRLRLRHGPTA